MKKPVLLVEKDTCFKLITQAEGFRRLNILELSFNYSLPKEIHRMLTEDYFLLDFFSLLLKAFHSIFQFLQSSPINF